MKRLLAGILFLSLCGGITFAQEQVTLDPAVTYGKKADFPLPKTIIFSVSPDKLAADAAEWSRHGVQAFFLNDVAREWSSDIWAKDAKPWTIGASDETFQKTLRATAAVKPFGGEVFLKVSYDHFLEWFNDTAWQRIENNFRQFAIFARDSGCTGIALDIEYIGDQYQYAWTGYDYKGYTREDLFRKVQERSTRIMTILYDEFPEMVFLTFPESGFSLGTAIHAAWIEVAAQRNAPGGIHYCTESTYRMPDIRFMLSNATGINQLFDRVLSDRAKSYWQTKCSIVTGVWPFGFNYQTVHAPGMSLEALRQGYASSLMVSSRYNWIYGHNCVDQVVGHNLDAYTGTPGLDAYLNVFVDREIITTPKYLGLAREVRAMKTPETARITGMTPTLSFSGPEDLPRFKPQPKQQVKAEDNERNWKLALDYYHGRDVNLHTLFNTQKHWMLIGPFPNAEPFAGHDTVYGPERELNGDASYDGIAGKVGWKEVDATDTHLSVDLKKVFTPGEHATAYALCYVTSPERRKVQMRVGANDAIKLWVGEKLLVNSAGSRTVYLDDLIINTTLPKGTTPILFKTSNNQGNWGFVCRLTDSRGQAFNDLVFSVKP